MANLSYNQAVDNPHLNQNSVTSNYIVLVGLFKMDVKTELERLPDKKLSTGPKPNT